MSCFCTSFSVQPTAFRIPISLERATRLASMVLMMRNMAPPRAIMEASQGELVGDLGNAAHQLQEGVGTGDGDTGQLLADLGLHLGEERGVLEPEVNDVDALGIPRKSFWASCKGR